MVLTRLHEAHDDDRGVVLVMVALMITVIFGMSAFVIDLGHARETARNEQAATDGAALAAAQELPTAGADPAKALAARNTARSYIAASLNGTATGPACEASSDVCEFTVGDYEVEVITPYTLPSSGEQDYSLVYVESCITTPAMFSVVWGGDGTRVCRSAVSRNVEANPGVGIGIISLHPTASCSIGINGNNTVTVQGGAVLANSAASPAICGSSSSGCGSFTLNAALVAAVGSIADCVEGRTNGEVVEGAEELPDPFASLPASPCDAPAAVACSGSPLRPTANGVCSSGGMSPGYFASGCNLGGGNGTTQMTPGVYWFNGTFDPRGYDIRCATCSAANGGVLMYFNAGTLSHTGNGTVNLLPYQSGQQAGSTYAGLSIFQRVGNLSPMTVGGTTGSGLGSIYAKGAVIQLHGNVTRTVNGLVVGDTINFNGNTTTTVIPPSGGPTTQPVYDLGLEK